MITSLRLKDFKNFADETLQVGAFTVIVGTNASGKSNIRDALRFLHGIGRGYTLAEIIGGKFGGGGQKEWASIRGAMNEIIRLRPSPGEIPAQPKPAFGLEIGLGAEHETAKYSIEVSPSPRRSGFRITYERLQMAGETIYEKPRSTYGDNRVVINKNHKIDVNLDRPAIVQVFESREVGYSQKDQVEPVVSVLESMRFLEFSPVHMREPGFPSHTLLGDQGANLAPVLKEICEDPVLKSVFMEWIRELTPMDVNDLGFPLDQSGRVHLEIKEVNGAKISAYSVSDGTLRFLAILAALLGQDPARFYIFEEIDSGIHPARLQQLTGLIEQQTAKSKMQVVTTTHSPDLLSMVNDTTFKNTSVVCRLEGTQDAVIRAVSKLPETEKLRKSQGLGRLLATGWMEDALAFTEGGDKEDVA